MSPSPPHVRFTSTEPGNPLIVAFSGLAQLQHLQYCKIDIMDFYASTSAVKSFSDWIIKQAGSLCALSLGVRSTHPAIEPATFQTLWHMEVSLHAFKSPACKAAEQLPVLESLYIRT